MSNLINQLAETADMDKEEAESLIRQGIGQVKQDAMPDAPLDKTKLNRAQRRRLERETKRMKANPVKINVRNEYDKLSNEQKVNLLNKILAKVRTVNQQNETGEKEDGVTTTD